jgi:hypothetical protein
MSEVVGPLKLLSIDAWRDGEGGWNWNNFFLLEEGIFLPDPTPRKVLRFLRNAGFLTDFSKGLLRVDFYPSYDGTLIEIQHRHTFEPVLALSDIH